MNKRRSSIEQCYRIYNEIEDIGKSIKASKRRARWTFCFGEEGNQKEVVLIHSLVSGKKTIFYNNRDIHQSSENIHLNFTHTWYDEKHLLRLDIYPTGNGKGSMYELLIDGLEFYQHPVFSEAAIRRTSTQNKEKRSSPARSKSSRNSKTSRDNGSKTRSSKVIAPPPDLLSMDAFDDPISQDTSGNRIKDSVSNNANATFDPFGEESFTNTSTSQSGAFDFSQMQESINHEATANDLQVMDFSVPNQTNYNKPMTFDASFKPFPTNNFTSFPPSHIQDISKEGVQQNGHNEDEFEPFSEAVNNKNDIKTNKIENITSGLVNLDNILDDDGEKMKKGNIDTFGNHFSQSKTTDHRSLDSIKASQEKISQNEKKPAFIVREPVYPQVLFQQNQVSGFQNITMPSNQLQNNNLNTTVGSLPSNIETNPAPKSGPMSSGYQAGMTNMMNTNTSNQNHFSNQFPMYGGGMGMQTTNAQMGLMSQADYPPNTMMGATNKAVSNGQSANLFSQPSPAPSSKDPFGDFGF